MLRSPDSLVAYNMFAASACMLRRDVAVAVGGFHEWWGVEDFDLWVRVLEKHSAICSPAVTVLYHVHGEQVSSDFRRMHGGHREVVRAHLQRTNGSLLALERWEAIAAWDSMRALLALDRPRAAVRHVPGFVRSRHRIIGLSMLLWSRFLSRRRTAEIGRDGAASVALFVHEPHTFRAVARHLGDEIDTRPVVASRPPGQLLR